MVNYIRKGLEIFATSDQSHKTVTNSRIQIVAASSNCYTVVVTTPLLMRALGSKRDIYVRCRSTFLLWGDLN